MGTWGSQGRQGGQNCGNVTGPRDWWIMERTGQAVQQLADPAAPHSRIDKLGGTVGGQSRLHNPGLQRGEIKPQTSE